MSLFQLDPASIAARVRAAGATPHLPTFAQSLARGALGFTIVSVGGFAPWVICDLWLHRVSELQLYLACTAVFISSSGVCLHRLILGPGSLSRFYELFTLAFIAYAVLWIAFWVWLRGDAGSYGGLLAGTAAMGGIIALAFDAPGQMSKVIAALFLLNSAGYYLGGRIEGRLALDHRPLAMLLWGVCYGLGLGAGLGIAFHLCQENARRLLRDS